MYHKSMRLLRQPLRKQRRQRRKLLEFHPLFVQCHCTLHRHSVLRAKISISVPVPVCFFVTNLCL